MADHAHGYVGMAPAALRVVSLVIVFAAGTSGVAHAIREGGCLTGSCPDSPRCAQVAVPEPIDSPTADCYCVDPQRGIVRQLRYLPTLRRWRLVSVAEGTGAEPDDYGPKPVPGGGQTLGLTGPITALGVSLRQASALQASPDGLQLFVTLDGPGVLLILDRDPSSGVLNQNGVARFGSDAELKRLLEWLRSQPPLTRAE